MGIFDQIFPDGMKSPHQFKLGTVSHVPRDGGRFQERACVKLETNTEHKSPSYTG